MFPPEQSEILVLQSSPYERDGPSIYDSWLQPLTVDPLASACGHLTDSTIDFIDRYSTPLY